MATTRSRQSVPATPGPAGPPSSMAPTSSRRTTAAELPPYEPPAFSLNPEAQRQLTQLSRARYLAALEEKLKDAKTNVTESAIDINDRLREKEQAKRKRRNRDEAEGGGEDDTAEKCLEEMRDKVTRMTKRMDESMRKMIDGQKGVEHLRGAITEVAEDAHRNASTQATTQNTRSQRNRHDQGEEDDEYQDFQPTDPAAGTQAQPNPIDAFRQKSSDAKTRYQSYTLTARYANENTYRDFRKLVHDAQHGDDESAPVLPHQSEWFTDDGPAPAPGVTTRSRRADDADANESDDDIAVSRATISTKCPLTLREFSDPLSSIKCSHSFEAAAIRQLLAGSAVRRGGRPGGEREVQCPVSGCDIRFTAKDLEKDVVLVRKIKRLQRAKELEEQGQEGEEVEGTQRNAAVVDDDEDDGEVDVDDVVDGRVNAKPTQMKREPRGSAAPRAGTRGGTVTID